MALRYDLTVPLSRYLKTHGIKSLKRYCIGKVYRRDHANIKSGRYREFYQCDYDICGNTDPALGEFECICVIRDVLKAVGIENYIIRINDRKLLDAMFNKCSISNTKEISSAIDKLDKISWEAVENEMNQKGLADSQIQELRQYLTMSFEDIQTCFDENVYTDIEKLLNLLKYIA